MPTQQEPQREPAGPTARRALIDPRAGFAFWFSSIALGISAMALGSTVGRATNKGLLTQVGIAALGVFALAGVAQAVLARRAGNSYWGYVVGIAGALCMLAAWTISNDIAGTAFGVAALGLFVLSIVASLRNRRRAAALAER